MTSFGQYPLVYQLRQLGDGSFIPVGLAEASSLGSLSATTIVVSSISATNYQGLNLSSIEITGVVVSIDTTGTGQPIIDTTDPENPKIRSFAVTLENFLSVPSVNPGDGEISLQFGGASLSVIRGGTGLDTITTNEILYGTGENVIGTVPAPITPNTYLNYDGTNLIWTSVTGTGTGGASFPNTPGRIPVTNSTTTTVNIYADLTYDSATKVLSTYAINNVCDVCAVRFNEGGTLLSDKYQSKDAFLTTLSTQATVNLANTQVCGILPITKGGTGGTDVATAQSSLGLTPGSDIQVWDANLDELSNLTLTDKSILVGGTSNSLTNIAAPVDSNTFLKYSGGSFIWTGVDPGINSFPNEPGRIPYIINSTTLGSLPSLNIETGVGRFNVCEVYTVNQIYEGGTSLANKYQACDVFLNTLAFNDAVRLNLDVTNTLPINRGGTNQISFNNDQLIYGQFSQNANLTFDGTTFKSPTVCATTVCGADLFENGVNITAKYETQTNAANTYLTKTNFNSYSSTLSLSSYFNGVQITSPTGGQALKWNSTLGKWTNQNDDTGVAGGTPGGNEKNVQINYVDYTDAVVFSGNDGLTYDLATSTLRAQYYSNLPSASPYWNANQLSGYPLVSGVPAAQNGPVNGNTLIFLSGTPGFIDGWYYDTPGSTTAGGSNTQVQFNNATIFSGSPAFIWDNSTSTLQSFRVSSTSARAVDMSALSFSAFNIYPTTNGVAKRNWIFYGHPVSGYITQNNQLWFSADGRPGGLATASGTLFCPRFAGAGANTTNFGTQTAFLAGRYIANVGATPGLETDSLPPTFEAASSVNNNLAFFDTSGQLCNTSSIVIADENGDPLGSQLGYIYSLGLDANYVIANTQLNVLNNAIVGGSVFVDGQVRSDSVSSNSISSVTISATNYLNLPSSTLVWSAALSATNAFRSSETLAVVKYVKNTTGQTIPKGTPVTITGATGDNALVTPLSSVNNHVPEAIGLSNHVFGLTQSQILNDDFGYIITEGVLSGTGGGVDAVNTASFAAGDILYVSSNGQLSNVRPPAPYESHPVGYVLRSNSNVGSIYVKIETVPEINDIVGFNLNTSILDGDIITYDLTTSTFVNKQTVNVSGQGKFGSVSATSYLNLPSGTATWNANKINGYDVTAGAPNTGSLLIYQFPVGSPVWQYYGAEDLGELAIFNAEKIQGVGVVTSVPTTNNQAFVYESSSSKWKPGYTITYSTSAPSGGADGDIHIKYFTSGTDPAEIGIACSDETTNLTSGTAKATFRMPYAMYLTEVRANVNTAPSGSTIIVDVNKNGSTIFGTRVSIDSAEKTSKTAATAAVINTSSLADDDEITIDIDQVGSTTAGKGLKVWLIGSRV